MSARPRRFRRVRKKVDKALLEAEILQGAAGPVCEMKREDWAALRARLGKPGREK